MNLNGTITPSEAQTTLWDVVVIGAGVAGSVAARESARAGHRVLLIDKRHFPRRKVCGACLNDVSLNVFVQLGLSETIQGMGGHGLNGFTLRCGRRAISVPLPGGLAISRELLDATLIREAISTSVEFLPDCVARIGQENAESREVKLRQNGNDFTINGRVIIVASGLEGSSFPDSKEWTTRVVASSRVGAGCLIQDDSPNYSAGTIWMAAGAGGYSGLVRVEDGRLNIAAAFDRDYLRQQGSPGTATRNLLEKSDFPIPDQLLTADWQGTVPLTRTTTPVSSRRVFLIGDAAGYVEPFTGEGMAWGLLTAQQVSVSVEQALSQVDWCPSIAAGWITEHRRLVHQRQRFCRFWARLLRSPTLISMALSAFSTWPWLARQIIERVNSHSNHGRLAYECRS